MKRDINKAGDAEKFKVFQKYKEGNSLLDISKQMNFSYKPLVDYIKTFYDELVITRETEQLKPAKDIQTFAEQKLTDHRLSHLVNQNFLALLSDEEEQQLNPAEHLYVYTYSSTGNNLKALEAAGLIEDIKGKNKKGKLEGSAKHVAKLRGIYLRNRPKISTAIKLIQEEIIERLHLDKSYVQTNLIQNIEELKEEVADNPRQRGALLKAVELLGKTLPGTFSETVQIQQIDPSQTINKLIELAKADITKLPPGSDTEEAWEYLD